MGGRWANWRDGKLSTRRRAIRRYVLWPCCKPRWRRYVLWPCCKPRWRAERHVADRQGQVPAEAAAWDGSAPRPAENGGRRGRASVGWRGTTYTWIRWRVTRRPGAGWGGTHTGERAGAPPPATEVRLLGQPGHRPRDAAGTPDIGRPPATSAAPESQRLARVVTRVSGRRSHRWATQRKRRHLSDLSDVPPVGSPSARIAVVCAVRTGDHQRAHAGQAVGGTAQGQVDGWISGARV